MIKGYFHKVLKAMEITGMACENTLYLKNYLTYGAQYYEEMMLFYQKLYQVHYFSFSQLFDDENDEAILAE